MIKVHENTFVLETEKTTYVFHCLPSGHMEHLYYGKSIGGYESVALLKDKRSFLEGNTIAYDDAFPWVGLENLKLEFSGLGKGDIREPFIEINYANGSRTSNFLYQSYKVSKGKESLKTLPSSYGKEDEVETLTITLYDCSYDMTLVLTYHVFEKVNIITRSAKLSNTSDKPVVIERLMSTQLDLDIGEYKVLHFSGAWAREMQLVTTPCQMGKWIGSSITGTTSSRKNPFVMVGEQLATEDYGEVYGFNLIYSGNHYEAVETNSYGKVRFINGIQPQGFAYTLLPNQCFEAPEAVMTFSDTGYSGVSSAMHVFIRGHIVRGDWQYKERPILINSWESFYFNFTEDKLLKLAKTAKELGIELFVLDDGWFGERENDKTSLGDWAANKKKLPKGLEGLSQKINDLGMVFGIWVEPEMVSESSECYKKHPDWVVRVPEVHHSKGRYQMILDLTQEVVQNYLIEEMTKVFSSGQISYVKWDMNRIFSDFYSPKLPPERQKEFSHRYVMGLYKVLEVLTRNFPHILFEGCAAGGNRFDLGMLCYMPQIWASDNTDAVSRASIQTGYSYGYPMSVISAHVSECPNHQTLREVPLETRFEVACFGLLGYECDLNKMTKEEREQIKSQIAFYKKHRQTLQFGDYYRIKSDEKSPFEKGVYQWMSVSSHKEEAIVLTLQGQVEPNFGYMRLKTKGLDEEVVYHFENRAIKHNIGVFGNLINTVSPIPLKKDSLVHQAVAKVIKIDSEKEYYKAKGKTFNNGGVVLSQSFSGIGYDETIRLFQDYHSRLYTIRADK